MRKEEINTALSTLLGVLGRRDVSNLDWKKVVGILHHLVQKDDKSGLQIFFNSIREIMPGQAEKADYEIIAFLFGSMVNVNNEALLPKNEVQRKLKAAGLTCKIRDYVVSSLITASQNSNKSSYRLLRETDPHHFLGCLLDTSFELTTSSDAREKINSVILENWQKEASPGDIEGFVRNCSITVAPNENPWVALCLHGTIQNMEEAVANLSAAWKHHALVGLGPPLPLDPPCGFYTFARHLYLSVEKDEPMKTAACANILLALLRNTTESDVIAILSSREVLSGDFQGATALHWITLALNWAAEKNNKEIISAIIPVLFEIIRKLSPEDLFKVLSQEIKAGNYQGTTALYWITLALNWAAEKNNKEIISAIIPVLFEIIQKLSPEDLFKVLSQERKAGNYQGATALHWITLALNWAAEKNNKEIISAIIPVLFEIIRKLSPEDLFKVLSQEIKAGNSQGATALYWITSALDWAAEKKNQEIISAIIPVLFEIIQKLPYEKLDAILSKKIIRDSNQKTLMQVLSGKEIIEKLITFVTNKAFESSATYEYEPKFFSANSTRAGTKAAEMAPEDWLESMTKEDTALGKLIDAHDENLPKDNKIRTWICEIIENSRDGKQCSIQA